MLIRIYISGTERVHIVTTECNCFTASSSPAGYNPIPSHLPLCEGDVINEDEISIHMTEIKCGLSKGPSIKGDLLKLHSKLRFFVYYICGIGIPMYPNMVVHKCIIM